LTFGPTISVVVVSDYEPGPSKSWDNERRVLAALAGQDIDERFDILLVVSAEFREIFSAASLGTIPGLHVIFTDAYQSAKLKDHGVRQTFSAYIAVIEADCIPSPDWLRLLVDILRSRDDISVVSGRTGYGEDTALARSLSLLDRGFDDLGQSGLTDYVSNNGAVYRREVLARFPYPDAVTPFLSSRLRNDAMRRAGHRFYFERRAVMKHALGGWRFVRDLRRNRGYAEMSWHGDKRYTAIPRFLCRRLARDLSTWRRLGPRYLRAHDWPLAMLLLIFGPLLDVPGMIDAINDRDRIRGTAYR
jgi:hypothetical protein